MAETARAHMTVDEFFAWEENQPDKHELVDGLPLRMMAGATNAHNDVVINMIREFSVRLRGGPCRPFNGDSAVETKRGQIRRPMPRSLDNPPAGSLRDRRSSRRCRV